MIPVVHAISAPDPTIGIAVCFRADGSHTIAAGSEMENCAECKATIWVHPTTKVAAPNAKLVCLECAAKLVNR